MTGATSLPAALIIYGICLPVAVVAGYLLARPTAFTSFSAISAILMLLISPLMLRWHHAFMIFAWNSFFIVFLLPGQPNLGIVLACGSLFISVLNRSLYRNMTFIRVPSVTTPLIFLTIVIMATAYMTGGFGARTLGSANYGGKRYLLLLGAIIGYFAMIAVRIPEEKGRFMASIYFLSGISAAISDLIYMAGPSFYFLFILFSSNLATMQAVSQETLLRFSGLTWGSLSLCYFLLLRYGVKGIMDLRSPWRLALLAAACAISLFGGFRSTLIILGVILAFQFYFEGLYKTIHFPILAVGGLTILGGMIVFIDQMPMAVQRSLSFLPIDVDPMAKQDALSTLDWRLQIWKIMLPEIPKYLLLGKGFSFSGTDLYLIQEGISRGLYNSYEDMIVSGNYHNGLLTTIIPFGIFGVIGFFWFCWASLRVLHANYKHGSESLKTVNTFLLVFFCARLLFFLVFYGQLDLDMVIFTGAVGLSISVNGGVAQPREQVAEEEPAPAEEPPAEALPARA